MKSNACYYTELTPHSDISQLPTPNLMFADAEEHITELSKAHLPRVKLFIFYLTSMQKGGAGLSSLCNN